MSAIVSAIGAEKGYAGGMATKVNGGVRSTETLSWSACITLCMFADQPGGHLDTAGYGIPGGTIRGLRQRGLIEHRSWLGPVTEWTLTKAGWVAARDLREQDDWRDRA